MTETLKKISFKSVYKQREWQKEADKAVDEYPVFVGVTHRGAGKTVFVVNKIIERVMRCPLSAPRGYYIAPFRTQAKEIAWDGDTGFKPFLRPLEALNTPKETFVSYNESELRIDLPGNRVIKVVGADNEEALRGKYSDITVLDEYQGMNPDLLPAIIRPTLLRRKNSRLIITGTPLGKNQFHEAYMKGQDDSRPDWSSMLKTWKDTGVYTWDELKDAQLDAPELFEQEYNCSWDAAIIGAFYGKQIERLLKEDRIVDKEYDPMGGPVVAGLDLGLDGTAIWYLQMVNGQPIIIDFDFFQQEDARHTINILISKEYIYSYIVLGHDGVKRFAGDKRKSVKGQFIKHGFKVVNAKRLPLLDAISAGRNLIDRCQITEKCYNKKFKFKRSQIKPLDALALYMPKFDKTEGIMGTKEKDHDPATHIGEAMRNLAVGLKSGRYHDSFKIENKHSIYRSTIKPTKTKSKWNILRRRDRTQ